MPDEESPRTIEKTNTNVGWAVLLIGIGIYFLFEQVGIIGNLPADLWVYALLLPIGWLGWQAWQTYQQQGYWSNDLRNRVFLILMMGAVVVITLIPGFTFNEGWPVFLIIIGVMALLREGEPPAE